MKHLYFILILLSLTPLSADEIPYPSPYKIRTLYNSLNPKSISQHLAFYQLYPGTAEGEESLKTAWALLSGSNQALNSHMETLPLKFSIIESIINVVNKQSDSEVVLLSDEELQVVNTLASGLSNRGLRGHSVQTEAEVLQLEPHQIDLARGLFLSELGSSPEALRKLYSYEAMIDLIALQILVDVERNASPKQKIKAINHFIFEDLGFRFPPHSLYAKDIDLYTFLPSVLDSRRGVCLGVSILYICLAQRLNLTLEMITPPGHIYVRYRDPVHNHIINIETTARGIDMESDRYLSIETRSLQQRNIKEVIGLAHFNQAGAHWHKGDHEKALEAYIKAQPYIPNDMLLAELMGYAHLLSGNEAEGVLLLKQVEHHLPDYAVAKDSMAQDYLNGNTDVEGIKAIFKPVDEKRTSVIEKREALQKVVDRYPKFRSGVFSLGVAWLQLHREGEALELLERYHRIEPNDPTAEYYLTVLYAERHDYNKAWEHFKQTEKLVAERDHHPKVLKELRKQLSSIYPD